IGLALIRYANSVHPLAIFEPAPGTTMYLVLAISLFGACVVCSVAVIGFLGLVFEVLRGRTPAHWGIGRWSWSFAGLYALAIIGWGIAGPIVGRVEIARPGLGPH